MTDFISYTKLLVAIIKTAFEKLSHFQHSPVVAANGQAKLFCSASIKCIIS